MLRALLARPASLAVAHTRAATKKAGGSASNRTSNPKYLGVKKYGGEQVVTGNIIIRQRGNSVRLVPQPPPRPPQNPETL